MINILQLPKCKFKSICSNQYIHHISYCKSSYYCEHKGRILKDVISIEKSCDNCGNSEGDACLADVIIFRDKDNCKYNNPIGENDFWKAKD